jgi:hypothetical protein
MKLIMGQFIPDVFIYKDTAGKTNRKAEKIDQRIEPIPVKGSPGTLKIIAKHKISRNGNENDSLTSEIGNTSILKGNRRGTLNLSSGIFWF